MLPHGNAMLRLGNAPARRGLSLGAPAREREGGHALAA